MLNLKVKKNDEYFDLDLKSDTKISFSMNSGIWEFEQITGSYSLPFQLPLSAKNNSILEFPNNLNIEKNKTFETYVYINGILFKKGILTIESADINFVEVSVLVGISSIYENKDTKIETLDIFGGDIEWTWKNEYDPSIDFFCLPEIIDLNFLKDTFFEGRELNINQYSSVFEKYLAEIVIDAGGYSEYAYPIVPHPQLRYILVCLLNYLGFDIKTNHFDQEKYDNLCIMNLNDACYKEYDYSLDAFFHELETYNIKNHLPDISVGEFLRAIHAIFAIDFKISGNDIEILHIGDYIDTTEYIDITTKVSKQKSTIYITPIDCLELNWETHPDAKNSITQLLSELSEDYFLVNGAPPPGTFVPGTTCWIDLQLTDQPFYIPHFRIWGNKLDSGNIIYEWNDLYEIKNENFQYTHNQQNYFSSSYFISQNKLSISLGIAPFTCYYDGSPLVYTPEIDQPGNSWLNYTKKRSYSMRLAFYNGFNDNDIPIISHIGENFKMELWSINGLYYTFWEKIIRYIQSVEYEQEQYIFLTLKELIYFDFSKKYKIGNELFFVKSLDFSIDINGNVSASKAILMPANSGYTENES